ncbi:YpmS family protein [Oenococcus oeni]|uniref:DUF2140 family protein n=6 Tax=Oenococcus oeni TaxID=1247 RepID=A0NJB5_OENOE|nr:YpmS family protein [Oenococcus oeni]EAV39447.1 hypothetical protein OENOO_56054 [Oenococcus oeni ATCC BAA-1163]AVI94197.1 hypothetical protein AX764_04870 [Oenococcus oeni]EJO01743.1 hypothetical protein AWRIB418_876 [Oenococcus oeni AWRIB418]KDE86870.1 hypothetical protein EL27_01580 [Oenococcus oeni]KEP87565.1 hypothetical protein X279_06130 [Oenococcus oeni IOEB_0501]
MAKEIKIKKNKWFLAFWSLLAIILIMVFSIFFALFSDSYQSKDSRSSIQDSDATFNVVLTRKQVNAISAKFLKEQKIKNLSISADSKQVYVYGDIKFLGSKLNVGVVFDPSVTKNGNVLLKAKKLVAGSMPLPIGTVMSYIKATTDLPSFIGIDSSKKDISINLAKMKTGKLLAFKAKTINLPENKIIFQGGLK